MRNKTDTDVVELQVGVVVFDAVVEDGDDDALTGVAELPRSHHVHIHPAVSTAVLTTTTHDRHHTPPPAWCRPARCRPR